MESAARKSLLKEAWMSYGVNLCVLQMSLKSAGLTNNGGSLAQRENDKVLRASFHSAASEDSLWGFGRLAGRPSRLERPRGHGIAVTAVSSS